MSARGGVAPWSGIVPLSDFPADARAEIERQIAADKPPPKWLYFGGPGPRPLAAMESRAWYEWHWARGRYPGQSRPKLSKALRLSIIERDGFVCGLCGGDVEPADVHIDHIIPVARGGKDDPDNLQVAHSMCNIRKGATI